MDYYDWRETKVECPGCRWNGAGSEMAQGETFEGGAEHHCPRCGHYFGFQSYPTADQVRTDPRADPSDKRALAVREERLARHEATKLTSHVQLPSLNPTPAHLDWDVVEIAEGEFEVQIRHGDRVIWREMSWYENYARFEEVAIILKQKYGQALKDLVPTRRSQLDLFGDRLSAPSLVESVRKSLGRQ